MATIPWQHLQGIYGPATDFPRWLQQLASPDLQVCQHAFGQLENELLHTYASEAASYAVPFLLRLLLEPQVLPPVKAMLLETLCGLAAVRLQIPDLHTWRKRKEHAVYDFAWRASQKTAVGLPIYLTLLASSDPFVRLWATNILISFPEQIGSIRPAFLAAFQHEQEPRVRANLVEALACAARPKRWQWFFWLSRTEEAFVAFMALQAIPRLAQEDTPEAVIEQLAAYLLHPPASLEAFVTRNHIRSSCLRSLFHLKKERLQFLIPWLMSQCEDPEKEIYHALYPEKLVGLLFEPRTDQRNAADLTKQQKAALSLLWGREDLWKNGNFLLLLKSYGLPSNRTNMATAVGMVE